MVASDQGQGQQPADQQPAGDSSIQVRTALPSRLPGEQQGDPKAGAEQLDQ